MEKKQEMSSVNSNPQLKEVILLVTVFSETRCGVKHSLSTQMKGTDTDLMCVPERIKPIKMKKSNPSMRLQ